MKVSSGESSSISMGSSGLVVGSEGRGGLCLKNLTITLQGVIKGQWLFQRGHGLLVFAIVAGGVSAPAARLQLSTGGRRSRLGLTKTSRFIQGP